jgi:transcriptional regulator with XRE-family HTH domain
MLRVHREDFRIQLQGELLRRCRDNPRYSLRAFARYLGVEPSFLSKILNGKRSVTLQTLERLCPRLGLNSDQFITGLDSAAGDVQDRELRQLQDDQYRVVADWYHFAILELMSVPGFLGNPAAVSHALGISQPEAKDALARLERLGSVQLNSADGNHISTGQKVQNPLNDPNSSALKQLQRQVLLMALQALEETPANEREQSTSTIAVDPTLLPVVRDKIKEFRNELSQFLDKAGSKGRVYHMCLSMYPVSGQVQLS